MTNTPASQAAGIQDRGGVEEGQGCTGSPQVDRAIPNLGQLWPEVSGQA
jgi:hypothetical protein